MSVWESTTYKLDVAKAIYEVMPERINKILGPNIGKYLSPRGDLCELISSDSWSDVASVLDWEQLALDDISKEEIDNLTNGVRKWYVGMHAVYLLIHAIRNGRFQVKDQFDYALIERRMRVLGSIISASTMITPSAFAEKWARCDKNMQNQAKVFDNASEGWKFYARNLKIHTTEYEVIDQERYFGYGERVYYGGSVGGLVILKGSDIYTERGLILTRKHVDMVIGACARIAGVLDFASKEYASDLDMQKRVTKMLDLTITTAHKCSSGNIDKVVQAFHKSRAYVQMMMFENIMTDAMEEACLEYQKKNLQTVLELPKYVECFVGLPKGRWLDILHIYKWMPPPDYDATYAFTELYEHHMSTRKSALDPGATSEMKALWSIVVRERKLNLAMTYHKIHGKWPGSLGTVADFPTEYQLDIWDPKAIFPYYTYGTDVTAQIKDKATVLARLEDEERVEGRMEDKNFLLWFLKNKATIDTKVIADDLLHGGLCEDNYVRVAYKGEAHKPGSRLFFMAPPRQRIVLGEMEGNISRIASDYPASLQGIDALTRANRLEKLFCLENDSFRVEEGEEFTGYIVTFDLSKFSPKFNPAVLQELHAFWAKVFSYEPIVAFGKIGAEGTILHTTNKLVMQYKNQGADLEGFRGRMMTLFHADLISAACRYAKNKGYIVGKSHSAVFIDDGAVKIAASGTGVVARANALKFLECMQKVYEAAGQENHPNKTIVSAIGGELLAEQYLYGQRLKCPMKAAMRLFPPYESPASAITEEFDALFSTAQGSVKDGADWVVAYRRLAEAYAKCMNRWARREFKLHGEIRFAFRMITPKSMGGFGFPTLQALVSTTAYDMTSEGLGMLSAAAKSYNAYVPDVKLILRRRVVCRNAIQTLRDPGRVRLEGPIIVEGRLASALLKKLGQRSGPWSSFISLINDPEVVAHAEAVAKSLLEQDSVSIPVLKRAWDCLPLAYIEGIVQKFQRASSIQLILSDRELTVIRTKNRKDVSTLLRHYF